MSVDDRQHADPERRGAESAPVWCQAPAWLRRAVAHRFEDIGVLKGFKQTRFCREGLRA